MINEIGWIGNICFLIGAVLLAKKKISGWVYQILGNLCYVGFGILVNKNSLWILSILLIIINIYGIYQWNDKKTKKDRQIYQNNKFDIT